MGSYRWGYKSPSYTYKLGVFKPISVALKVKLELQVRLVQLSILTF